MKFLVFAFSILLFQVYAHASTQVDCASVAQSQAGYPFYSASLTNFHGANGVQHATLNATMNGKDIQDLEKDKDVQMNQLRLQGKWYDAAMGDKVMLQVEAHVYTPTVPGVLIVLESKEKIPMVCTPK